MKAGKAMYSVGWQQKKMDVDGTYGQDDYYYGL